MRSGPGVWIVLAIALPAIACAPPGGDAPDRPEEELAVANPPSPADVLASYVLLAAGPAAYARVIQSDGFDCPTVATDCSSGTRAAMTARAKPRFDSVAHCPPGGCFPVTVCEAAVDFDQSFQICLNGAPIDLPVAKSDPARLLVMGDTGCKDPAHEGGECQYDGATSELAEPFATLVSNAGTGFDLVLHMGDYNYRGTPGSVPWLARDGTKTKHYPYDAGDGAPTCEQDPATGYRTQASSRSLLPDQWDIWRKDFFEPAGPLLAAAPWVFARGNHELCSRAGSGFFYFLDAGFAPAGTQVDCPALPAGDDHPPNPFLYSVVSPMAKIDLPSLSLLLLDSANACDDDVPAAGNGFRTAYEAQFKNLTGPQPATTWIASHRPFWTNKTLQTTSSSGRALGGIALSLAGHMHLFESITPTQGPYPGEIVAGNGGVELSGDFDTCSRQGLAGQSPWVQGAKGYGFLHLRLGPTTATGPRSWSAELIDPAGATTASCDSTGSPSLCTVAGSVCS